MHSFLRFALAGGLVCGTTAAQYQISPSNLHPLPSPLRRAGVFDWDSKSWLSSQQAHQARASTQVIYDNTCVWVGGGFYTGTGDCEDYFDSGRIPGGLGGGPTNPLGSTPDNNVSFFEFSYCTAAATGSVDIKVGFYDNLGGPCLNGIAPTPPPLATQAAGFFDFGAAAGFPLPGGVGGAVTCWVMAFNLNSGFCLQSDGDGVFDNVATLDGFSWSFQMENPSTPSLLNGLVIAGDPLTSAPGGCTYNVPCGGGGLGMPSCGTGLGQTDSFWINVDASSAGSTTNTGVVCVSAPSQGTGCYWFGGYPTNAYSGFYMRIGSSGPCSGCSNAPTSYCTSGTTTNGCTPQMLFTGIASASAALGGDLVASNLEAQRSALIFVGYQQQAMPWSPGSTSFLCVKAPTLNLVPLQNSGGVRGQCNGSISVDLNAYVQASSGVLLGQPVVAGLSINAQGWFRDPPAPKSTNLTNAINITFCP